MGNRNLIQTFEEMLKDVPKNDLSPEEREEEIMILTQKLDDMEGEGKDWEEMQRVVVGRANAIRQRAGLRPLHPVSTSERARRSDGPPQRPAGSGSGGPKKLKILLALCLTVIAVETVALAMLLFFPKSGADGDTTEPPSVAATDEVTESGWDAPVAPSEALEGVPEQQPTAVVPEEQPETELAEAPSNITVAVLSDVTTAVPSDATTAVPSDVTDDVTAGGEMVVEPAPAGIEQAQKLSLESTGAEIEIQTGPAFSIEKTGAVVEQRLEGEEWKLNASSGKVLVTLRENALREIEIDMESAAPLTMRDLGGIDAMIEVETRGGTAVLSGLTARELKIDAEGGSVDASGLTVETLILNGKNAGIEAEAVQLSRLAELDAEGGKLLLRMPKPTTEYDVTRDGSGQVLLDGKAVDQALPPVGSNAPFQYQIHCKDGIIEVQFPEPVAEDGAAGIA